MEATAPESTQTGRYRPIALLGQGGMARVLLTVTTGPAGVQKLLVVKEIRPELANDAEFVTMFMDEARLAARLNHRNIVHTYEVGLDTDGDHPRPFIVMEYLEGQSLQALINRVKRDKMPIEVYLRVLTHALAGLHYAHELKDFDGSPLDVVHRDVTPQNVFVGYDGQVKLVDFGIAKAAGSAARTEAGTFKGKLGYVAPEQIDGSDVDRRADIFSVGVMIWEAIARRRLTAGETEGSVLHKRTHGTHTPIRQVAPDVPERLAAICDRAMSLERDKRHATAAELQAEIEAYLDTTQPAVSDRDVGALATEVFAVERERIREVIEGQLARVSRSSSFPGALPSLPRLEVPNSLRAPRPSDPPLENAVASTHSSPPAGTANASHAPAFTVTNPRERVPRGPAIAIAIVLVLGLGVGAFVLRNRRADAPAASASAAATQTNATPTSPTTTGETTSVTANAADAGVAHGDVGVKHATPVRGAASIAASATPSTTASGAGADIPKDPKPKHTIDEKDPY